MVRTAEAASTTTSAGNSRRTKPDDLGHRRRRRTLGQRGAQQRPAEEEARKHQENVDTAGNAAEPHVEHRDERDCNAAQTVEIVAIGRLFF